MNIRNSYKVRGVDKDMVKGFLLEGEESKNHKLYIPDLDGDPVLVDYYHPACEWFWVGDALKRQITGLEGELRLFFKYLSDVEKEVPKRGFCMSRLGRWEDYYVKDIVDVPGSIVDVVLGKISLTDAKEKVGKDLEVIALYPKEYSARYNKEIK